MNESKRLNPWTNYWQKNETGNSFNNQGKVSIANYSKENEEFWKGEFKHLKKNAVLVDLATGNGALLKIANHLNNKLKRNWTLNGVDMAKLSPSQDLVNIVHFFEETDMCSMPFEAGSIDLITSQYGFEYADSKRVITEVSRTLKTDGSFVAVAHNNGSYVTQISQLTVEAYGKMRDVGVFELLDSALIDSNFGLYQQQLLIKMKPIVQQYNNSEIQNDVLAIMQKIGVVIKSINQLGVDAVSSQLSQLSFEFQLHEQRLKQQINASLNQSAIENLEALVKELNMSFVAYEKKFKGDDKTWIIKINKCVG